MKIVKEGEKKNVLCHHCGPSTATYLLRDVDFSDHSGIVKNVLAAVCDKCDQVVGVPSQSTPKIKAQYDNIKSSMEIRVPAHYLDILNMATDQIAPELNESFHKNLLLYYLHAIYTGHFPADGLASLLHTELAEAKSSKRLSMKLSEKNKRELDEVMQQQGLTTRADVLKAIIIKIHEDVIRQKRPDYIAELKQMAAAFS
ncbi:hypothetical protein [Martelella alba]|uniref:HNH endonuclease n=1 Tax=Martelella alba TaxID=2590451 RepID=A0ABY2SNC2_9HYPH|nr:hypothetical protein [Martelella alba]TKI07443.1 hypothetical protein FCN80_06025 [Martelella alba]